MGTLFSSSASVGSDGNFTSQVFLNIYDLTPLNSYTYWFGLGIFHSGIEVHGLEYGYGAHDFPTSGVFEVEPKHCPGFIYRCSISLGNVDMSPDEFRLFMENLASEYHGDTYHLISKNCNHFSDDVCSRLTGRGIPGWVNRLARLGALCSCLLPESLQQSDVKQMPEYHMCSEGGSEPISITTLHDPTESEDADHEKLLSSPSSCGEVAFIKEVQSQSAVPTIMSSGPWFVWIVVTLLCHFHPVSFSSNAVVTPTTFEKS